MSEKKYTWTKASDEFIDAQLAEVAKVEELTGKWFAAKAAIEAAEDSAERAAGPLETFAQAFYEAENGGSQGQLFQRTSTSAVYDGTTVRKGKVLLRFHAIDGYDNNHEGSFAIPIERFKNPQEELRKAKVRGQRRRRAGRKREAKELRQRADHIERRP